MQDLNAYLALDHCLLWLSHGFCVSCTTRQTKKDVEGLVSVRIGRFPVKSFVSCWRWGGPQYCESALRYWFVIKIYLFMTVCRCISEYIYLSIRTWSPCFVIWLFDVNLAGIFRVIRSRESSPSIASLDICIYMAYDRTVHHSARKNRTISKAYSTVQPSRYPSTG